MKHSKHFRQSISGRTEKPPVSAISAKIIKKENCMNKLKSPKVQGSLRHLFTAIGPVLALIMAHREPAELLKTMISDAGWPSLVGVIMAATGFWASLTAPEKKQK